MEVLIYSGLDGVQSALGGIVSVETLAPSQVNQALRMLTGDRPPDVLYVDDTRPGPTSDLWNLIRVAQQKQVTVLANMVGPGQSLRSDMRMLGIEPISERETPAIVAWIADKLNLAVTTRGKLPIIAVGAAKGGIGKTFVTCVLAEGLRRRGLRVLVWDSDISNPGMVSAFRIPASAPSYLHLVQQDASHWNAAGIAPFIFQPEFTRARDGFGALDFLIGSHAVADMKLDIQLPAWQALYHGVSRLPDYDVVIIDTPPDYLRRPYATSTLLHDGYVVLPCPPGARERMGVAHMLDHVRHDAPAHLDHAFLVFIEPEKGVTVTIKDIVPMFGSRYPEVRVLGTIPRAPRLASLSDEHDGYISTFDLGPTSIFSQAAHRMVDSFITQLGLVPTTPMPKASAFATFKAWARRETFDVPPANTSVGALARELSSS